MRPRLPWFLTLGCLLALTLACYGRALLRGEQFGYRDAAHYYYPLHQRVQAEWEAGRWPLWEPEENGGMPLLGNPTAAVLYPGKLIFAAFPYPLAARLYVVAHTLLAFGAMLAMMRSLGVGPTGATLSALAYAFGAPILFQYCNIIYLVGASWLPFGFRAVDRWLRLGKRLALPELAVALAMETLGGDPESAYLTGVSAAAYAWILARQRTASRDLPSPGWVRACGIVTGALLVLAAWIAGTMAMAWWAPGFRPARPPGQPSLALPWMSSVAPAVAAVWTLAGLSLLARWRSRRQAGRPTVLAPMLLGLAGAAALAVAVSAAQLFPVLEFTGQSARAAGEGPHDVFPFSLAPTRVVEFLWPNVFGTPFQGNRHWLSAVPPKGMSAKVWVPSLYVGGLTLVLALGALRSGVGAPWRGWMAGVLGVSLVGSFGEYTGPLWWARAVPSVAARVGPRDTDQVAPIRADRQLRDGDGSLYWALATALPGFRQFRFPGKLLTLTVLSLTALAGLGWDALASGDPRARRRTAAWSAALLGLSLLALAASLIGRGAFLGWLRSQPHGSAFGPLDVPGALAETQRGLAQAVLAFGVALVLALRGDRRPGLAAAVALLALTADLAAANARYVVTVPQRLLDGTPEVVSIIKEAENATTPPGPYRVHRMPVWQPYAWQATASDHRVRDFVEWERGTIQPKYGLSSGVQYTMTFGVAELYDYEWYFGGFLREPTAEAARALGTKPGQKVVVFPRRSFDMWNTRYFVLPYFANHWSDENRGFASFLDQTERIYPPPAAFQGAGGGDRERDWVVDHDFQVRRNDASYPRAWVVHGARYVKAIRGLDRSDRDAPMQEILYAADFLWHDPTRIVYDPKRLVWVDLDRANELAPFLHGVETRPTETVTVTRHDPDRVELQAVLEGPGMVVLADVYYPGWVLTIDGQAAPIYRANRIMRGAAVASGRHTLVYTYRPASFRVGLVVSGVGLLALAGLGLAFARDPVDPALAPSAHGKDSET